MVPIHFICHVPELCQFFPAQRLLHFILRLIASHNIGLAIVSRLFRPLLIGQILPIIVDYRCHRIAQVGRLQRISVCAIQRIDRIYQLLKAVHTVLNRCRTIFTGKIRILYLLHILYGKSVSFRSAISIIRLCLSLPLLRCIFFSALRLFYDFLRCCCIRSCRKYRTVHLQRSGHHL